MHIESGVVVEVSGGLVLVESDAKSGCGGCSLQKNCAEAGGGKKRRLWMENRLGAHQWEKVTFTIREQTVLLASVTLYLMPVLMLIAGAFIGSRAAFFGLDRDLSAAAGGIAGLAVSLAMIRAITGIMSRRRSFIPELLEIIAKERDSTCQDDDFAK